ncbi:heterogeneous nuclear ribonucleoprotein Q isoform X1 [Apium graveolens]|uniref:heterogeneous nuclear ribonucleoprotein Q isoform X1 n=1 Tax=Apium graveolens TaxID=4045 RepID=UPI003D7ACDB8
MADGAEVEDRVDFDDDNYEEMDDDVEEQLEEGGDEDVQDEQEDLKSQNSGKESPEDDRSRSSNNAYESVEDEDKPSEPVDDEEKQKRAELLALPPHGSEVFIGALPRDITEEDLRDLCDSVGDIVEIRLMKNKDTGESKGFAFVSFKTKDVAQKAIEQLHSKDYKGRTLRCSLSETKYRLFIGNVPKNLTEDEFKKLIDEVGPGAEHIELIKDPQTPSRNRGFAFVEYFNNSCADYSRQKMSSADFKLEGNTPTVTWADPKSTPDHSSSAQVKALYVKNIPENTPSEQLKELFERHGEVKKVVMPPSKSGGKGDFGFIHFAERSSALKAVNDAEKYEINGQVLEVVLAKPQSDRKSEGANIHNSGLVPNYIPNPGYGGFPANPYAAVGAGYGVAAGYQQQPMIYGRGPMPAGMQMVPMVLPDGRIGYVLQQPGVQMPQMPPRRNDRTNGTGGPQGRGRGGASDVANRGRRYRPY